jgi:hypothetical protein
MIAAQITMSVTPNAEMMGAYLGAFVGSYLWGAYFIKSKRCKNTYLNSNISSDGVNTSNAVQRNLAKPSKDGVISSGLPPLK